MINRILMLFAAIALLAACETATGSRGGSGSSASESASFDSLSTEEQLVSVGNKVLFGYNSASLSDAAKAILSAQAAYLRSNPAVEVTVEGHCDERGTREFNLALGERRASAARDFLVAEGIDGARIKTISYGKERPEAVGSREEAWSRNRRAVSVIR